MASLRSWWHKPAVLLEDSRPAPLPCDRMVGGFQVGQTLGDGGTATVYEARGPDGAEAALKIPHRGLLRDPEFVAAFRREAELGTSLRHPSIVRVHLAGVYRLPDFREVPFFAMERLRGRDLQGWLHQEGRLETGLALAIARAIADALDWAHHRGVVHRDISPGNIFLTCQKSVKVMDFGISALCHERRPGAGGPGRGTPAYLAPERLRNSHLADPRVDLYSLGCVLYEMLAGRPPFQGEQPDQVLRQHLEAPAPALPVEVTVPWRASRLVARLLEKDPERRCATAREVLAELAELL